MAGQFSKKQNAVSYLKQYWLHINLQWFRRRALTTKSWLSYWGISEVSRAPSRTPHFISGFWIRYLLKINIIIHTSLPKLAISCSSTFPSMEFQQSMTHVECWTVKCLRQLLAPPSSFSQSEENEVWNLWVGWKSRQGLKESQMPPSSSSVHGALGGSSCLVHVRLLQGFGRKWTDSYWAPPLRSLSGLALTQIHWGLGCSSLIRLFSRFDSYPDLPDL